MIDADAMSDLTVRDLLATHEAVLAALRDRGVVRTDDTPAQQYALWLAHEAFGGAITPESTTHDLMTPDGRRLLVRSVVVRSAPRDDRQLAPFRNVDFDELLVILFDASYDVIRASLLTNEQVMRLARWKPPHGRVLIARDAVLALGTDVRRRLPSTRATTGPVAPV